MEFRELSIGGVFEITPRAMPDERGFFMRVYDSAEFAKAGLHREWLQENHSRSVRSGVIRGLHFQREPFAETKLVRCIRGEVFDVVADLRDGSTTFGHWVGINLSEENKKMLFVPRGCAHGFCTLTGISEVVYKADNIYSPEHEGGIIWNDPTLGINWPTDVQPFLSAKDQRNMTMVEFMARYK